MAGLEEGVVVFEADNFFVVFSELVFHKGQFLGNVVEFVRELPGFYGLAGIFCKDCVLDFYAEDVEAQVSFKLFYVG